MSHPDSDVLASMALREDVTDAARAHLESCEQCQREVAAYADTLVSVSGLTDRGPLMTPPSRVWDAITAEVSADAATAGAQASPASSRSTAGVTDELAERRARKSARTSPWLVGVAAAAGLVIGGVGVGSLMGDAAPGQVVASAELADLGTEQPAGTATVHTRDDGTAVLVVDTEYEQVDGAYLEVWLIDPNVEGMISLGPLTGDSATFAIPDGFEVAEYPIVDVSVEPLDGVPTHSGDSITRGVLDL